MAAQQYKNAAGVLITAELVEDASSEYNGLYRVTDKDGNVGHITPEQLADNFTDASAPAAQAAPSRG